MYLDNMLDYCLSIVCRINICSIEEQMSKVQLYYYYIRDIVFLIIHR